MPCRQVVVRTVVLSPEDTFATRVPVLFSDTLEEGRDEEVVPVAAQVQAVGEAGQTVTDNGFIAMVGQSIVSIINDTITIQVFDLDVARISDVL